MSHSLFYTDSSVTRSKNKSNEKPLLFDNSFNILENTLFGASAPAESGLTYRVRCRRHIIKHENTTLQIWDISEHINHKLSDGTAEPDMGEKWNYIICIRNIRLCAEHGVSVFWVCLDISVSVWGIWCADQSWDVLNWPMCEGCTMNCNQIQIVVSVTYAAITLVTTK